MPESGTLHKCCCVYCVEHSDQEIFLAIFLLFSVEVEGSGLPHLIVIEHSLHQPMNQRPKLHLLLSLCEAPGEGRTGDDLAGNVPQGDSLRMRIQHRGLGALGCPALPLRS